MRFHFGDVTPYIVSMLKGLGLNLTVASLSLLTGIALGLIAYSAKAGKNRPLRILASCYIELIRNTPLLVQLYLLYFGLAQFGVDVSPLLSTMLALIVNSGAYVAEIMRAGFQSVSPGTIEAGHALGMTRWQIFLIVRLKPAFRSAFPALINQFVLMFLGSTVASTISLNELMYTTLYVESVTARTVEVFLTTGVMFYVATFILVKLLNRAERALFQW